VYNLFRKRRYRYGDRGTIVTTFLKLIKNAKTRVWKVLYLLLLLPRPNVVFLHSVAPQSLHRFETGREYLNIFLLLKYLSSSNKSKMSSFCFVFLSLDCRPFLFSQMSQHISYQPVSIPLTFGIFGRHIIVLLIFDLEWGAFYLLMESRRF